MKFSKIFSTVGILILIGCAKSPETTETNLPTTGDSTVTISWTANRETDVNMAGGGYRVYYAFSSGVSTSGSDFVDVPYVSGPSAPTSVVISDLASRRYYFRVVAYSAYNPLGVSGGNQSSGSTETFIDIP